MPHPPEVRFAAGDTVATSDLHAESMAAIRERLRRVARLLITHDSAHLGVLVVVDAYGALLRCVAKRIRQGRDLQEEREGTAARAWPIPDADWLSE